VRQLGTISTAEALEQDLERRVLQGEFSRGEHLREIELSEDYGVGRHTLRAAFDRLVRRGLLVKQRNRGVSVRELTPDDLREIYELREAIEVETVRILAGRRTVPEEAQRLTEEVQGLTTRSPRAEVIERDLGFHRALVEATGNSRLLRVHEELGSEILLCLAQLVDGYTSPKQIATEHTRLLESIQRGRTQAGERAVRDDFARTRDWLIAHAQA
jgi:DNA-binding GntR family transcriptional regulator